MRLTDEQVKIIKTAVINNFGGEAKVRLFGSRVDDTKRGGDIDLFIDADLPADQMFLRKINTLTELQLKLGERKIDIITFNSNNAGNTRPLIVQEALSNGVEL